jgi:hypothetical protein
MVEYNHISRVVPGTKNMSPIVSLIVDGIVKMGAQAKLNSRERALKVFLHFGGIYMLYKYWSVKGIDKTCVVFHGTDLHGFIQDLSFSQRLKYRLNSFSNRILMVLCDEILVVSNSLLEFVPMKHMTKTSVLFLGVDCNRVRNVNKLKKQDVFGFVDNNNRRIKNPDLAYNYGRTAKTPILRLSGYDHKEFLSILSSCNRGLLITSFQEASPNVLKEAVLLGLEVTCVEVGDCLDIMKRFGGNLISYDGVLVDKYEPSPSYSSIYLSIDATIFQLTHV